MKKILKETSSFFGPFLVFLVSGLFLLALVPAKSIFLWVNQHHSPFLDNMFRVVTTFGNGWVSIGLMIIVLLWSYRAFLVFLTAFLSQGILVQFLKKIIFSDMYRPIRHFQDTTLLHFVEGIDINSHFSFPSGHSATAFCFLTLATLWTKNNRLALAFFVTALLAAYSRIYLFQHFFADIYAGAIIGVLSSLFWYYWFYLHPPEKIKDKNRLNKGLIPHWLD